MAEGRVKWFNSKKGYGFIAGDGGKQFFVHHASIEGEAFKGLQEGDRVCFEEEAGATGRKATKVRKL